MRRFDSGAILGVAALVLFLLGVAHVLFVCPAAGDQTAAD